MAEDRADVDDHRTGSLLQQRQGQPGHLHQGEKIHLHDPPHAIRIGILEKPHRAHAGVVDQDIQPAVMVLRRLDCRLPGGRFNDIAQHHLDVAAGRTNTVGQLPQPILAAGDEHHFGPLLG